MGLCRFDENEEVERSDLWGINGGFRGAWRKKKKRRDERRVKERRVDLSKEGNERAMPLRSKKNGTLGVSRHPICIKKKIPTFTFDRLMRNSMALLCSVSVLAGMGMKMRELGVLTIQPWMQKDSASELGFDIPSRASISSVKGDLRKDRIGRRVSRTNKIQVEKGKFAKLDNIGMDIGTCIDVPDRLMLLG
ncbi:hypothetical protein V6N12_035001 [Hibiscus sabdariffa]|uniref:Uncharacterized protein n=1 Tax=Hibiscus sabdariffa TaxID=183260 RepID=A0ABR2BQM1_9ROSI